MYAICFDFPEMPGEPQFATWDRGVPFYGSALSTSMKFAREEDAERFLQNSYARKLAELGRVVEVG